jgi:hypothetical protein
MFSPQAVAIQTALSQLHKQNMSGKMNSIFECKEFPNALFALFIPHWVSDSFHVHKHKYAAKKNCLSLSKRYTYVTIKRYTSLSALRLEDAWES